MSTTIPSYGAPYGAYPSYGAASYGYGAPAMTASYMPTAAYAATPSYGSYGYGGMPAMDEKVIAEQKKHMSEVFENQAKVSGDMLKNQYDAQIKMLDAEATRNKTLHEKQVDTQFEQQKSMLTQAWKQQTMQLDMAKQQREMAVQQQAAQMTAQASQYTLQMEMQKQMMTAYSGMAGKLGDKKDDKKKDDKKDKKDTDKKEKKTPKKP
jgi:hypothetical protein